MAVSYKKLWKLLIDHDMKKKDLVGIKLTSLVSPPFPGTFFLTSVTAGH